MAMQEYFSTGVDNLFAASQIQPIVTDKLTIAKSGLLKRGSLVTVAGALCKATTTGSGETATTTYDDVYAVLAEDVDTTDAAKDAAVYLTGEFNQDALICATGAKAVDFKASARAVCIFMKPAI